MIFTEKKITITKNQCNIDSPVVLYRGDYNVEIRFTIISSPHKYSNKQDTNIVESTEASYGQLVIRRPNNTAIFSEITATKRGAITFTITAEMIDEITEVGNYTFQIRLLDENKESRVTIPEVVNGIEIREPIATEDVTTTNEVGVATVGYALTTAGTPEDAFDSGGNYNKTTWKTGDRITDTKLNKIEQGITGVIKKIPHYNKTLKFEISGENYNYFMNNSYFNMNALDIDEAKSYIGEEMIPDEKYSHEFIYDKEADALISEDGSVYIYNHKSYDGENFIEDENSAVLTFNITPMSTGFEGEGYFRLYEIDKVELDSNCLPKDVNVPNSLTVGTRIGDIGEYSVAEGDEVTASGVCSHAEGGYTTASGVCSHAEGQNNTASGDGSHAEGQNNTASGDGSHAEGDSTIASSKNQHVEGKFNIEDTENKYAHIVGNGTADNARSNAHTLDWNGNAWYKGKLSQDGTPIEDKDLTTKKYVDDAIENIEISGRYVTKELGNANQITFADGQTFQAKLDAGTLKGEKGDKGDQGDRGADGLTTSISLNGVTYTQENGVITLPNITSGGNIPSVTQVEPEALDMPKVFFYGNALPTTKDNVNLTMDYVSNTAKFSSFVKLKCQGTSSMSYAKKNFTVSMFSDEARATKLKKDFKGWGAQSKFCLKANYVDTTHTRNISGARIAYDMVASRPDSEFKQQLLQCPRNGAVDGFPIKLYFNGEFYGIYTWNIPKDAWMFNMDESNPNHCVLCAERNTDGNANTTNSCQFRTLWNGSSEWSVEVGTASVNIKASFDRCINFVMTSTDQEFHDNIGEYFDLYSLLDYYCFSYLCCHLDGLAKNMLMATYDGVIWGASLYDMDSIYGVHYTGNSYVATNYQCPEQYQEQFSLLWQRIERCFGAELYARYLELRQGALSLSNIIKHVEEIYDVIPDRVFADEKAKWTSLPQVNTNTITRFRNYMRDRAIYVDSQMQEIGTAVPCTGIVLGVDTLSFTTPDTQTLSVVASPTNCTDTVTWSVSPTGVVSVNNGVVTPITNGSCTITVTCGSYSDTCSVTVSLPSVECTGITLDKTELALGVFSEKIDDSSVNYLDGVEWKDGRIDASGNIVSGADKCAEINVTRPGKYALATTSNYKALVVAAILKDNINYISGYTGLNPQIINIYEPCIIRCSVYPNSLDFDSSTISMTRQDFSSYSSKDVTFELSESDIHIRYSNSAYSLLEVYFNNIYDIAAFNFNNVSYKCICRKATVSASDSSINELNALLTKNLVYNGQYSGKSYINIVLPISMGTTASEILANLNSTTVTINPTSLINELDSSASQVEKLSDTITATVTPENCTQSVVWSVSPQGIVTVENGLVTAVTNGETTVTATCGTQSATCTVSVSGM